MLLTMFSAVNIMTSNTGSASNLFRATLGLGRGVSETPSGGRVGTRSGVATTGGLQRPGMARGVGRRGSFFL